jgi:DNA polymerase-3 subunit alpha
MLSAEKNAIGFYISGHPLENYLSVLSELQSTTITDLGGFSNGTKVNVGGLLTNLQVKTTKTGNKFALMRLEDQTGGVKCVCWPESYKRFESVLKEDAPAIVTGKLEVTDDGAITLVVEELSPLQDILQKKSQGVIVKVPASLVEGESLDLIFALLDKHRGDCEVMLDMILKDGVMVRLRPHAAVRVRGSLELEGALRNYGCQVEWLNMRI